MGDKVLESDRISYEDYKEIFDMSINTVKKHNTLTIFFNNSIMSKILDLFLDNQDIAIFTRDFIEKGVISQKSFYNHLRILLSFDIVIEIEIGKKKFYKWNEKNPQANQISKLRDMLDSNVRLSK